MSRGKLRIRLILVLCCTAALMLILLARGAYLALCCHNDLRDQADCQQTDDLEIIGDRGVIVDRLSTELVCTIPNPSLAVCICEQTDRSELSRTLRGLGACSEKQGAKILGSDRTGFMWINRHWIPTEMQKLLSERCPQIQQRIEMKRFYPAAVVAPEILGISGLDGRGLSGLEWAYDEWLRGKPGRMRQYNTGGGGSVNARAAQIIEQPKAGNGLMLTLDSRMQGIARYRLRQGMEEVEASAGIAILLDPWTGEILAIVEEPTFDPLGVDPITDEDLRISCLASQFEPGSTFKIVPVAAALENGILSPEDTLDCGKGVRIVGSDRIRDHRKFGVATVTEIISGSSNIGAGLIAEQVGWQNIHQMAQALGFGQPTDIELHGEAIGWVPHPLQRGWSDRSLVTMAYGQEVSCTGLQMALAFGAVANGGLLMKPIIVKAKLDEHGQVVSRTSPQVVRRAMSRETASTVAMMLREVVVSGTGQAAANCDFPPAGKTGTAQVFDPDERQYSKDDHVLSFVGYAPHEDARIVCAVSVWCDKDLHASEAAVPIFSNIIKDLTPILMTTPEHQVAQEASFEEMITLPDLRGMDSQAARYALHKLGLVPVLDGLGDRIVEMSPQPRGVVKRGEIITLALEKSDSGEAVIVPSVVGLSLRRAVAILSEVGLTLGANGSGWIIDQDPPQGTAVSRESVCVVRASPDLSKARLGAIQRSDIACQTR